MIRRTQLRRGVTLVEMMVASAMCVLMMWLFAWCYQQGLDSFRNARAQSELMDQEQMAVAVLTRDLSAEHFLPKDGDPDSTRVRGYRLDRIALAGGRVTNYTPPRSGYFLAKSRPWSTLPGDPNPFEGTDPDGFHSGRSTDHFLQFTVIHSGGRSQDLVHAVVPANTNNIYSGRAGEVAYFLFATGRTTPGGVRLFELRRRERVCSMTDDDAPAYNPAIAAAAATNPPDNISEVMTAAGGKVRTLSELTVPFGFLNTYRLPPNTPLAPTSRRFGEDILMSNVISFELKFTGTAGPASGVGQWPAPFPGNSDYPYDILPLNGEWDTFSNLITNWDAATNLGTASNPNGAMKSLRLRGVMGRIRAWEPRTNTTRQTTFIVDL